MWPDAGKALPRAWKTNDFLTRLALIAQTDNGLADRGEQQPTSFLLLALTNRYNSFNIINLFYLFIFTIPGIGHGFKTPQWIRR